ncbi:reverse transcriptase [Caerostris extrusa]|uniref:RNA-directed DNA polymerase n=1 Tax=Caerostris extrusa TaxID=172846 RepID=A0AAV4PRL9_CAEEX|nr:reverse transcriptase [Caerostris extrusa]
MLSVQGAQNSDPGASLLQNASLMSMVPSLSGKNVCDFFSSLSQIGQLSGWSHSQMLIIAKLKMEGNARKSLQNVKELTYEKFKEAMTSLFKETPPFCNRVCQVFLSQNEVSEGFKEKLLLSKFISGLKGNIRTQVLIADPSSFAEAVDFASRVERSFEVASPNVNVISQTDSNAPLNVREKGENISRVVSKIDFNHNQRSFDRQIQKTSSGGIYAPNSRKTHAYQKEEKPKLSSCTLPIIEVQMEDITCRALIDTGSTMNLMRNKRNRHDSRAKLVVPKSMVSTVLQFCHDSNSVAHPGLTRTLKRIEQNYFWQRLYLNVKNYIASCHSCIQRRGFSKTVKAPIQKISSPKYPFQKCAFDD